MRAFPSALLAHLQLPTTTTCRLLRIATQDSPPVVFGFTTLDVDVVYDDGDGEVVYRATNGFDPSAIRSDAGYSIDNAEAYALISEDVENGFTIEDIAAGALNDALWACYIVNFEDLSMGHGVLDAGDVGTVRTRFGMVWMPELLSYMVRLRQPIGHVDSRTCRSIFGTPADSQTGCGVDTEPLWEYGTVTAVGAESDRVFTGTVAATSPVNPYPGRVQFLTGANAAREGWTEEFDAGDVELGEPVPFPIEVGDTYRIRADCGKRYFEDCIGIWENGLNFKGEPLIPVGDGSQIQTPGAQLPGGGGWNATSPLPEGE